MTPHEPGVVLPPDEPTPDDAAADAQPEAHRHEAPDVDDALVEHVETLLHAGDLRRLRAVLGDLPPYDLAVVLGNMAPDDARELFDLFHVERAADVLVEAEESFRERLLGDISAPRIAEIVDQLDTDDAADVLGELDDETVRLVLPRLEDADELRSLLAYAYDTAGGRMATEVVSVNEHATVGEATETVRSLADEVEDLYVLFVTDSGGRLAGIVPLKRLLLSPATTFVSQIMKTDVIAVDVDEDQEDVARIMERYDLVSLPVVDREQRLVGRITIDDIVDVLREEAEEDLQVISGTSGDEELSDSVWRISRGRLPWLVVGLGGTLLSAWIVKSFEGTLEQVAVLAMFIPVMTAMAGNAAIQSAAITVQGLASGRLVVGEAFRRVGKELGVALLNGLLLGAVFCACVFALAPAGPTSGRLAVVAALALLIVIVLATVNGALIPVVLKRAGLDPALSMGPFVTTANDILGLSIYFAVTTALYV
jgi:magnesium transporter